MAKKPVSALATGRGTAEKATGRYLKGPPLTTPSASISRYFTPRVHSTNFVHMPSRPAMIIQNAAPGPPMASAAPTPAMFPSPTVPDTADVSAWKCVDFSRITRTRKLAGDHFERDLEAAELDEAEVDGEDEGGDDQPDHDDGDGPHGEEDYAVEDGDARLEDAVDGLLDLDDLLLSGRLRAHMRQ